MIGTPINGKNTGDLASTIDTNSTGDIILIAAKSNFIQQGLGNIRAFKKINGDWVQLGNDLVGQYDNDDLDNSISINSIGDVIAIGRHESLYINKDYSHNGYVQVFQFINNNWEQVGNDLVGDNFFDNFGNSVKLSSDGKILVVGAPQWHAGNNHPGYVKVYELINNIWVQKGSTIFGENDNDFFGRNVDLSDSNELLLAVGSYNSSHNNSGQIKTYKFHNNDWVQFGNSIEGNRENELLGIVFDLSEKGNMIVATSFDNDFNGEIQTFNLQNEVWTEIGKKIVGENPDEMCALVSVNADENILAVGCPSKEDLVTETIVKGHVDFYKLENNNWSFSSSVVGIQEGEEVGEVKLNDQGNIAVIGALKNDTNGNNSGQVRVYQNDNISLSSPLPSVDQNISILYNQGKISIPGGKIEFSIFDVVGKKIENKNLKRGIYFLSIRNNKNTIYKKIYLN